MRTNIICIIFIVQKCSNTFAIASNLCNGKKCVQKCCPEGEDIFAGECKREAKEKGFEYLNVYSKELLEVGHFKDFFGIKAGALLDKNFKLNAKLYTQTYKTFSLIENGSMFFETHNTKKTDVYSPEEYCIDHRFPTKELSVWYKNRVVSTKRNIGFLKWGFPICNVFLFLVLVVYGLLPELRNLGGLILMAYVASLMMGFTFFFTIQIAGQNCSRVTCLTLTSVTYFFLLASFCWLNVMSYDIWWTFRGCVKARPINRWGEKNKFLVYCVYAFGVPLSMTIALVTLNEENRKYKYQLSGIVPQINLKGCFLDGQAIRMYLYAPMLIMIVANWMFFVLIAVIIRRLSRGSKVLRSADSRAAGSASAHKDSKQRFTVYLKLSVLMGLNWILEVVSTFYQQFAGWYISDVYNILIGVVIFAIFVCKKKVFIKLRKRFTQSKETHTLSGQSKTQSSRSQKETETQVIS